MPGTSTLQRVPAPCGQDLQDECVEGRTCSIRECVSGAGERPKRDMGTFRVTVLTVAVPALSVRRSARCPQQRPPLCGQQLLLAGDLLGAPERQLSRCHQVQR